VTFRSGLNPEQTDALIDRLAEQHVTVVKHLDVKGTAHVRLSFHAYNTQEELHCFEPILKETMKRV
jgi:selenocysteine lyase/cysteine desulfurase